MDLIKSIFTKTVVGLDIGVSGIKAVELSSDKNISLVAYNRISLPWDTISPDGVIKNEAAIVSALKKLFSGKTFSTRTVSVAVFGNSVLSKPILMPPMKPKDIEEQIYWEAEQYIPFNIDECQIDFAVVGNTVTKVESGTQSAMEVLLVAAKKDYLQSFSNLIESAGLNPKVLDYQPFAIGNAFEFNYGDELGEEAQGDTDVIVDFGAGSTKLSFIEKKNVIYTNKVSACGLGCTMLLAERLGESIDQAEQIKLTEPDSPLIHPIITDYITLLTTEVQKNIDVFFSGSPDRHLRKVFYCGGGMKTPGLIDQLCTIYPEQTEQLNPIRHLRFPKTGTNKNLIRDFSCLGTVAVGLALRKSGDQS